jgi:hypothetical protein
MPGSLLADETAQRSPAGAIDELGVRERLENVLDARKRRPETILPSTKLLMDEFDPPQCYS